MIFVSEGNLSSFVYWFVFKGTMVKTYLLVYNLYIKDVRANQQSNNVTFIFYQISSQPQQSTSETVTVELNTSITSMSERDDTCSEKDRDSLWDKDRSASRASSSTSAATLTNVSCTLFCIDTLAIIDKQKLSWGGIQLHYVVYYK